MSVHGLLRSIVEDASSRHGVKLYYSLSVNESLNIRDLSPGERVLYDQHETKISFLQGRVALKKLCDSLSYSSDTSRIRFPHPHFSLTHSKSFAIAMYCEPITAFNGFGIDLECIHPLNADHARFYISQDDNFNAKDLTPEILTQIWTVKEAVFKADHERQSHDLKDYHLDFKNLSASKDASRFVFESHFFENWFFSLALRRSQLMDTL